jgi:hypothetical protein
MASELFVDNITGKTGTSGGAPITLSGDTATLSGTGVTFPAGHIIQVLQTVKTSDSNTQSTSLIDVPGMSVDITPKKSTSKILVNVNMWAASSYYVVHAALFRDSTELGSADAASDRSTNFLNSTQDDTAAGHGQMMCIVGTFLDSPTIPSTPIAITYKVQYSARPDGATSSYTFINRSEPDRDNTTYDARATSTITVYEVAQ